MTERNVASVPSVPVRIIIIKRQIFHLQENVLPRERQDQSVPTGLAPRGREGGQRQTPWVESANKNHGQAGSRTQPGGPSAQHQILEKVNESRK